MKHENNFHSDKHLQSQIPALNGLVLSGGQSTRMGRDKGEICYHDKSQRRYLHELLLPYCKAVYISCNKEQTKYINDLPKIEDAYSNVGPLGGILSAFQINSNVAWLVVACDLPLLNTEIIEHLIEHRNPLKMATAFLDEKGKHPEPMIAIWEPSIYAILLQIFKQNILSPQRVLMDSNIELLFAPDNRIFKSVNTAKECNEISRLFESNH